TRAKVSKRELYALVGNKEQMLAACVAGRGQRMRLPETFPAPADMASLESGLRQYGIILLKELVDPDVLAVFRLGISEAKRSPGIGASIKEQGHRPATAALRSLLRPARVRGRLVSGDSPSRVARDRGSRLAGALASLRLA